MYTKLTTILSSFALLALMPAALAAPADGMLTKREDCVFTAYTGYSCNGTPGDADTVTSDRCILAEDRHSFSLGSGCTGTTDAKIYTTDGCPGDAYVDFSIDGPGCYTVNTGAHWGSALVSV